MEPAVPFALLGVVQLLAVAGWLGLAGTACFPQLWHRASPAFVVGALGLAGVDAATALSFGDSSSALLAGLRAAGLALVAVGLAGRALQRSAAGYAGVVVPLGAPGGTAGAVAAWWSGRRRDGVIGALVAASVALAGASAVAAVRAGTSPGAADAVLVLRGLSALAALAVPLALARVSLLARVVGAILAGVVVMAAGSVGVVGQGVASKVSAQEASTLNQLASGARQDLLEDEHRAQLVAGVVAACVPVVQASGRCADLLSYYAFADAYFAAVVEPGRGATPLVGDLAGPALQQLDAEPAVTSVARGGSPAASTVTVLGGARPTVAVLGVAPGYRGGRTSGRPSFVAAYGVPVDDAYLRLGARRTAAGLTLIADGQVVASSLKPAERTGVLAAARRAHVGGDRLLPDAGVGLDARGDTPAVRFVPLTAANNDDLQVATLAVSQPAGQALAPQRSVLSRLFLTAVAVLVLVAGFAVLLGRRTVDPVQRLTLAAGRVRRGDLSARSGVRGRDEVGRLARAFDGMTDSLREMTGELRSAVREEAALRARLETVVASMSDGLVVTDPSGLVTGVNAAAAGLLGVDAAAATGRPFTEVAATAAGESRPAALDPSRGPAEGEAVLQRPDGSAVPVRAAVAPLLDADGRSQGSVVLLRDATREREVERLKTEFLSNVSHELRTPLTPIRGYAEILRRRPDAPAEKVQEYAETIVESTMRMNRVVDLLVDVAALEAGRVRPMRRAVDVSDYVDELLAAWRARWPERAPDLRRRVAAGLPSVDVDPDWLGKALAELADNAMKYTPPGTAVTVFAGPAPDGRAVRLGVRDAGPGVDPEQLPGLLTHFAQADASATRRVGGLGLGLSFVRRLAEDFGLPFVAASEPGRGAEFALDLPALPAPEPPSRLSRLRHGRPVGTRGAS